MSSSLRSIRSVPNFIVAQQQPQQQAFIDYVAGPPNVIPARSTPEWRTVMNQLRGGSFDQYGRVRFSTENYSDVDFSRIDFDNTYYKNRMGAPAPERSISFQDINRVGR